MFMDTTVSIFGGSLLDPIIYLIESLQNTTTNPSFPSRLEEGPSVAIALLSTALIESAINRLIYDCGLANERKTTRNPREFFSTFIDDNCLDKIIYEDFQELMAVRDAIIHNHLWEIKRNDNMDIINLKLMDGYGDSNFYSVVNLETGKTKRNNISVIPILISKNDAIQIFILTYNLLLLIQNIQSKKLIPCIKVSLESVRYKGKITPLPEIVKSLSI